MLHTPHTNPAEVQNLLRRLRCGNVRQDLTLPDAGHAVGHHSPVTPVQQLDYGTRQLPVASQRWRLVLGVVVGHFEREVLEGGLRGHVAVVDAVLQNLLEISLQDGVILAHALDEHDTAAQLTVDRVVNLLALLPGDVGTVQDGHFITGHRQPIGGVL